MSDPVVVTGGGGFVGSHLTEHLLERGHRVSVFDVGRSRNLEAVEDHSDLRFVEGDVRDPEAVREVIGPEVGLVYHLSAVVGVHHYLSDPLGVIDVNVMGTRNVLEAASHSGARVLVASTSEVYGKNPAVPWSEDDDRVLGSTAVDRWSYSTSKALCEHLALAVHRQQGLPVSVVRYFNLYGPRQAPDYVISQSVHRALRGEPPLLYDGGSQTRCFTFVADAVEGTIAAAERPEAVGEVFNLGNPTETSIKEAVQAVLEEAGVDLGWEDLDTGEHYGGAYEDIPRRIPDVTKARRVLGWVAGTPLREGIRRTVAWARANPWWLE